MSVEGYFGLPGSGKTYAMVRDVQVRGSGRVVYANFHLKVPAASKVIYMASPYDFVDCENGIVLIDEAGLWLPSFIFKKIPEDFLWQIAQVRKSGIEVLYSAQKPARVVKMLREITYESNWMQCFVKKYFIRTKRSGIDDEIIYRMPFKRSAVIDSSYDTMEKVQVLTKAIRRGRRVNTGY